MSKNGIYTHPLNYVEQFSFKSPHPFLTPLSLFLIIFFILLGSK